MFFLTVSEPIHSDYLLAMRGCLIMIIMEGFPDQPVDGVLSRD